MIVRVEANVQWRVLAHRSSWVGICDPLKLTVEANTYGELMESISETLDAVLSNLNQTDELHKFLKTHGWTLVTPLPQKPEDIRFDVPFIPAMVGSNGPQGILHQ
jgi:hypothetical protein